MPRSAASAGCICTGSRPATLTDWLFAPTSSWLCSRVRGWLATRCSPKRRAAARRATRRAPARPGGPGSRGTRSRRWPRRRSRSARSAWAAAMPLRVGAESANGDLRRARPAARCPAAQNSSKPGTSSAGAGKPAATRHTGAAATPGVAALGEGLPAAEPLRQPGEDRVVVPGLAVPGQRPGMANKRSCCAGADVVTLHVVVTGSTMSACRAVAVQNGSCTTTVSGRPNAARSRARSWW